MDVSNFVQYLDIAFIALLALGALIGFVRGIFKSTYKLVVFAVLLLVGVILSSKAADFLLSFNLNTQIGDIYISNLKDSLPIIASEINPNLAGLVTEGSEIYTVALELITMLTKVIFIIVWLLLMLTVFKFIFWIIYLIIKPRKKDEEGNKIKKTIGSRLGGSFVTLVHTSLIILVVCIPIAGISSLGNQLKSLDSTQEEVAFTAIPTSDGKLVMLNNRVEIASPLEGIDNDYFSLYRNSAFGKFCGMIKIGDVAADEKLFDQMFTFNYESTEVHLITELAVVTDIYNTLSKETGGKITLENILNIETDTLYGIVDKMSNLKLISVAIPVGTDYLLNSEKINEKYGDILENVDAESLLADIKNSNVNDSIVNLGKGFVDFAKSGILTALKGEDKSIITLLNSLDEKAIEDACEKIGDVELVNLFGEIGLGYILKTPAIQQYLEKAGLSVSDINLDDIVLGDEISSLGAIISAVKDLGLENGEKIDIANIEEEKINKLIDALYGINLFSQNTKLVVSVVREELVPEDYKNIIPNREMTASDLKSVAKVSKVLLDATKAEEDGKLNIATLLSDENIELLKQEGTSSEYLKEVIDGAGEIIVSTICSSFNVNVDEINLNGIVWVDELEGFKNLLNACEDLGIDLTGFKATDIDLASFTDEQISSFSNAVFSSGFMKQNTGLMLNVIKKYAGDELETYIPKQLNSEAELASFMKLARTIMKTQGEGGNINIGDLNADELGDALVDLPSETVNDLIAGIVEGTGAIKDTSNLKLPELDLTKEEDKEELKQTIAAMETISELEDITSIKDLTPEKISTITSSSIASTIVATVITEQTKEGGALSNFINTEGIGDDEWADGKDGEKGELSKLLDAASVLMDDKGEVNLSSSTISNLTDEEIKTITDSKVITNSLESNIHDFVSETVDSTFGSEYEFDLNLGSVTVEEGKTIGEAWAEEMTTIREVVKVSEKINEYDLSDKDTAMQIGEILNMTKDSQVLGTATTDIATTVLNEAYASLGQTAPTVSSETDFVAEFAKLQELLNK